MRPDSSTGLRYLPGLDGLRALAVLAVILFHSGLRWLPGGFLGVEVFFVISGFIITMGLSREHTNGGISLRHFWKRRALRLLPAVLLLLFVVVAYAELWKPGAVAGLANDSLAAMSYSTNWYLIVDGQSYFDAFREPSMLRHLWSLAIEEQFYVVWPLLALGGMTLLPRRLLAVSLVVMGIGSAVLMAVLFEQGAGASRLYYGTDTRASGLLLGAALAMAWQPVVGGELRRWRTASLELSGVVALCALATICLVMTDSSAWLYRGGFLAVDVLTAIVIVAAVHPASRLGAGLGTPVLRWIGQRSYGLYLWHWPIILVVAPGFGWAGGAYVEFFIEMAATVAIAEASYRWLEQPVRKGALGRAWARFRSSHGFAIPRLAHGGAAVAAVAAISVVGGIAAAAEEPAAPDYFALGHIHISPQTQEETTSVSGVSYYGTTPSPAEDSYELDQMNLAIEALFANAARERAAASATPAPANDASTEGASEAPVAPTPPPSSATLAGVYVTAVGDSVMLGAAREMGAAIEGIDVDAQVSRSMGVAISILEDRKARGILADTVVLHIGNNGPIDDDQVEQVAQIVDGRRTIIFSLRVPRWWEEENNAVLLRGVARHANFELLDWRAASGEHPEILWTDGIHLRPAGATVYTELLKEKLDNPPTPQPPVLSEIELPGAPQLP